MATESNFQKSYKALAKIAALFGQTSPEIFLETFVLQDGVRGTGIVLPREDELSEEEKSLNETSSKMCARLLLSAAGSRRGDIVIPDREEWIGINLLERDDMLPPRKGVRT